MSIMALLRDAKIVKLISEQSSCGELSEEACRYILANTELLMRWIVCDTVWMTHWFNRV